MGLRLPSIMPYKFQDVDVPYRSEKLEISKEEMKLIKKIKNSPVEVQSFPQPSTPVKCIIDTDIGTDFDDTMALLYALHLENIEILGVTTNYGPADLRAAMVRKIQDAYIKCHPEKLVFPIIAGASCALGSHRNLFLASNEGLPFYKEEREELIDIKHMTSRVQSDAADFMIQTCLQYPHEVTIIAIGIPTNIGLALQRQQSFAENVKEIVIMGGGSIIDSKYIGKTPFEVPNPDEFLEFVKSGKPIHLYPNHNVSGDTLATKILFESQIKIRMIPHDVTKQFWVKGKAIDFLHEHAKLENADKDPAAVCGLMMEAWFARRRGQNGQCPHDPLTVHEAVYGDDNSPLKYARGTIIYHEWAAFSTFIPHNDGNHYLAIEAHNTEQFLQNLENHLIIEDYKL